MTLTDKQNVAYPHKGMHSAIKRNMCYILDGPWKPKWKCSRVWRQATRVQQLGRPPRWRDSLTPGMEQQLPDLPGDQAEPCTWYQPLTYQVGPPNSKACKEGSNERALPPLPPCSCSGPFCLQNISFLFHSKHPFLPWACLLHTFSFFFSFSDFCPKINVNLAHLPIVLTNSLIRTSKNLLVHTPSDNKNRQMHTEGVYLYEMFRDVSLTRSRSVNTWLQR